MTDWTEHDGKGVPSDLWGKVLEVEAISNHGKTQRQVGYMNPDRKEHEVYMAWDWSYYGGPNINGDFGYSKIVRYRAADPSKIMLEVEVVNQ